MRIAISARTRSVLGATLIALILPGLSLASAESSGVSGIDGSSMSGIDGSSIAGIDGSSILGIDGSSVVGIDGSSALGIDGSSIAGIDGSSGLGIDGSSIAGIDGSSALGIDGSSALGIDGSSIAGIDGSSALGIDGSSIAGIDGSSALGIDGSSIAGIDGSSALGIDGSSIAGIDGSSALVIDGSSILLAGPVDSIDRMNGVFESMGQVVMASQEMLTKMNVGDFVAVEGSVISSGWYYADAIDVSDLRYEPGSTEVFLSGIISSINLMNGRARMGDLTIDYTSSLGRGAAPSDTMWSFRGTRPSRGGMMISNRTAGADLR
jgi:hypothetical protein